MRTPVQLPRPQITWQETLGHLIYNAMFAGIFGFYATRNDGDPEDCYAANDNDKLVGLK